MPKQKKTITSPQNPKKKVSYRRAMKEVDCVEKGKNYRRGTGCVEKPASNPKGSRANKGKTRAEWRAIKANDPVWVKKMLKKNAHAKSVNKAGELVY